MHSKYSLHNATIYRQTIMLLSNNLMGLVYNRKIIIHNYNLSSWIAVTQRYIISYIVFTILIECLYNIVDSTCMNTCNVTNITKQFLPCHAMPNCLSLSKAFRYSDGVVGYVHHFSTVRFASKWTKMTMGNQKKKTSRYNELHVSIITSDLFSVGHPR